MAFSHPCVSIQRIPFSSSLQSRASCSQTSPQSLKAPSFHPGRFGFRDFSARPIFQSVSQAERRQRSLDWTQRGISITCTASVAAVTGLDVKRLAQLLCGDWNNRTQALDMPAFWAHIRVCIRALPSDMKLTEKLGLEGKDDVWLFLENAYDLDVKQPYRMALVRLTLTDRGIVMENWKLSDESGYRNASRTNPEALRTISASSLSKSEGYVLYVTAAQHGFEGSTDDDMKFVVERRGRKTYLHSEFKVTSTKFITWDYGRCVDTNELVWGAPAGPFEFDKTASYASDLL